MFFELLGFACSVGVGLFMTFCGVVCMFLRSAYNAKEATPIGVVCLIAGVSILYVTLGNSPIAFYLK